MDLSGKPARDGGGIARSGADLENSVARPDLGRFEHQCDDVGLRDRLALGDRQRTVLVGEFLEAFLDKVLPRDTVHGIDHARVADAASGQLDIGHALPGAGKIRHGGYPL
jgi:hypothetical protein